MRPIFTSSSNPAEEALAEHFREISHPLTQPSDLDPLIERIGDARYVLLGEASHGTSEFYLWRAVLTRRLIREKGFSFVAVEGDWPDFYRVNRYVKGYENAGEKASEVLHAFERWPTWMWANWEVAAFAEWLRRHNQNLDDAHKAGFFGLDVYSLWESMEAIIDYLRREVPEAVDAATEAFSCFEPYNRDEQAYAAQTAFVPDSCENEVVELLAEIRRKVKTFPRDGEAEFSAEQNALVAVNAERYYRAMVRGDASSWNLRDRHMVETLERLVDFHGPKGIVWAHNTHVGDARETSMAQAGMVNIGQLVREGRGQDDVVLVGFGSYAGSVIAGRRWGAKMERMRMPAARSQSWEALMHRSGAGDGLMFCEDLKKRKQSLDPRGHRAIGVVYAPESEGFGNYVPTVLPRRYDAFLYLDETRALHPMHIEADGGKRPPETYPWGF